MTTFEGFGRFVDRAIELPVVTSFTNIGFAVRSRLPGWGDLTEGSLAGRTMVVTGGTSGIGRAAATRLASLGAIVVITGRDLDKTQQIALKISADISSGGPASRGTVVAAAADMGELDQVRALAAALLSKHSSLDALIHNAGALTADRHTNASGIEATVASQVYGPFLLTGLLLEALRSTDHRPARVVTVSSGGMYSEQLDVEHLEMSDADYNGTEQYARAKRAQVTLNELWAVRVPSSEVVFHAMHPGWADTPGVEASLPKFRKIVGPLLRSPEQGADTIVWLAADSAPASSNGKFWLDRATRSLHKLPATKRSDTPEQRALLWDRCLDVTGVQLP